MMRAERLQRLPGGPIRRPDIISNSCSSAACTRTRRTAAAGTAGAPSDREMGHVRSAGKALKDSKLADPQLFGDSGEKFTLNVAPGVQDTQTVFGAGRKVAFLYGKPVTEVTRNGSPTAAKTAPTSPSWPEARCKTLCHGMARASTRSRGTAVVGRFPDGHPAFPVLDPAQRLPAIHCRRGERRRQNPVPRLACLHRRHLDRAGRAIIFDPQNGQLLPHGRDRVLNAAESVPALRAFYEDWHSELTA